MSAEVKTLDLIVMVALVVIAIYLAFKGPKVK